MFGLRSDDAHAETMATASAATTSERVSDCLVMSVCPMHKEPRRIVNERRDTAMPAPA